MGDRTYTSIRFSGTISHEQAEELAGDLRSQGCQCELGPKGVITVEHLKLDQYFWDDECNYAHMEDVENFCREHEIAYCKEWQAGGDYGPGMMVFTGTAEIECGTIDGEPAITLGEIKRQGTGFMAFLDSFDFSTYPPLTITEEPTHA